MKRRKPAVGIRIISALFIFLVSSVCVMAAGDYKLLQADTNENQIVAYIEGDTDISQLDCQIGMVPCEEVQIETMKESQFPFHTIVLVDNSLSITQANRDKILDLLKNFVREKNDQEYISIAVYGEDIEFLIEKSQDVQALEDALERIEQHDQDTYLTDILYDLLDTLEAGEYTRFLVVSDGVDNKSIGITKEELTAKLKDNSHPVYTLGHVYKNNETELENMFALSRATNGKEFLLDGVEDITVIISELEDVQDIMRIRAAIPDELQDGSSKNVLFTIQNNSGTHEIKIQVDLPFSLREPEPGPEPTEEPTPAIEPTIEPAPEPEEEPVEIPEAEEKESGIPIGTIAAILVIIGAIVVLILNKKSSKTEKQPKEEKVKEKLSKEKKKAEKPVNVPESKPSQEYVPVPDPEMTVMLDRRYLLVLKDVHSPGRIFKYPLDDKVVIGRNTDKVNIAIDYNLTVSGQHCEIYARSNRFYIRDLNSSNKTCLNGHVIKTETELFSGSIIKVGEVEFSVEMLPI